MTVLHPVCAITRTVVPSITVFIPLWWELYQRRDFFVNGRPNHSATLSCLATRYLPLLPLPPGSSDPILYLYFPWTDKILSLFLLLLFSTLHIPFLVLFKTSKAVIQQLGEKRFDETHLLLRPCWPGSFTLLFLSPVSCSNKSSAALKAIDTEMMWAITSQDNSEDFQ